MPKSIPGRGQPQVAEDECCNYVRIPQRQDRQRGFHRHVGRHGHDLPVPRVQQRLAHEFGLPGQVAMEQQMACGIGMCFCCVRDFNVQGEIIQRRVCWDGPVFDLMEALP